MTAWRRCLVADIEFLPDWYRRARERRRRVALQGWLTLLAAGAVGLWTFSAGRNVTNAEGALGAIDRDLNQSVAQIRKRGELEKLRAQLKDRERIDTRLGANVELSRVFSLLDHALPAGVAILEADIDTTDRPRPQSERAAGAAGPQRETTVDHMLLVTVKGVSPTNVEVANFMETLLASKMCQPVRLAYARDRVDSGHVMCEFALDFSLDLSMPGD